jgi:hypothetical protein
MQVSFHRTFEDIFSQSSGFKKSKLIVKYICSFEIFLTAPFSYKNEKITKKQVEDPDSMTLCIRNWNPDPGSGSKGKKRRGKCIFYFYFYFCD